MIARIWRGWAPRETADEYQRHFEEEVAAHLTGVHGFRGARLLRRAAGAEVEFTAITFFTSMHAVRAFAGVRPERAVVEDAGRAVLTRWDEEVAHHHVAVDI